MASKVLLEIPNTAGVSDRGPNREVSRIDTLATGVSILEDDTKLWSSSENILFNNGKLEKIFGYESFDLSLDATTTWFNIIKFIESDGFTYLIINYQSTLPGGEPLSGFLINKDVEQEYLVNSHHMLLRINRNGSVTKICKLINSFIDGIIFDNVFYYTWNKEILRVGEPEIHKNSAILSSRHLTLSNDLENIIYTKETITSLFVNHTFLFLCTEKVIANSGSLDFYNWRVNPGVLTNPNEIKTKLIKELTDLTEAEYKVTGWVIQIDTEISSKYYGYPTTTTSEYFYDSVKKDRVINLIDTDKNPFLVFLVIEIIHDMIDKIFKKLSIEDDVELKLFLISLANSLYDDLPYSYETPKDFQRNYKFIVPSNINPRARWVEQVYKEKFLTPAIRQITDSNSLNNFLLNKEIFERSINPLYLTATTTKGTAADQSSLADIQTFPFIPSIIKTLQVNELVYIIGHNRTAVLTLSDTTQSTLSVVETDLDINIYNDNAIQVVGNIIYSFGEDGLFEIRGTEKRRIYNDEFDTEIPQDSYDYVKLLSIPRYKLLIITYDNAPSWLYNYENNTWAKASFNIETVSTNVSTFDNYLELQSDVNSLYKITENNTQHNFFIESKWLHFDYPLINKTVEVIRMFARKNKNCQISIIVSDMITDELDFSTATPVALTNNLTVHHSGKYIAFRIESIDVDSEFSINKLRIEGQI